MSIVARNVRAGRGEIDLLARDGDVLVAVEVKAGRDPALHFTEEKIEALRAVVRRLRPMPQRIDLVTVQPTAGTVRISWIQAADQR